MHNIFVRQNVSWSLLIASPALIARERTKSYYALHFGGTAADFGLLELEYSAICC